MKKKVFLKAVSVLAVAAQILSCSAFAAVTESGTGTAFWKTDFNEFTADGTLSYMAKSANVTYSSEQIAEGDYAIKLNSANSNNDAKAIVLTNKVYDFTKPVAVSYDFTISSGSTKSFRADLTDASDKVISQLPKINENSSSSTRRVQAFIGGTATNSSKTITAGTKHNVTQVIMYNQGENNFTIRTFFDGVELVRQTDTTSTLVDTRTNTADITKALKVRFYPYYGGTVTVDNVVVCNLDVLELPESLGWVTDDGKAPIVYKNAQYKDTDGETVTISSVLPENKLTNSSQYEMKKYNIKTDPLMLSGSDATSAVGWSGKTGVTISGLTFDDETAECYVMKLNNPGVIKNLAGNENKNSYIALHTKMMSKPPVIREGHIYDAEGNELALENGKLPVEAKKLEFTLSNSAAESLSGDKVKIEGKDFSKEAVKNGTVYTINIGTLSPAESYTVTVGDTVQTLVTTGTNPYAFAYIDKIDSEDAISKYENGDDANITLSYSGGKLKYDNKKTTGTANVTLDLGKSFDFSKGALLASFEAEANQTLQYLSSGSNLILTDVLCGSKSIGMLPALEHGGIYGITLSSGTYNRNTGTAVGAGAMKSGTNYTVRALIKYYPEESKLGVTQFIGNERLCDRNGAEIAEYFIENVTEDMLQGNIKIRFSGRNFADGGMLLDNISVTTIDKIDVSSLIKTTGGTATPEIKSSVLFEDGTDEELTKAKYISTADKSNIIVNAYEPSDVLLSSPTPVRDFGFDKDTFTISGLEDSKVYTIELEPGSVKSFTGESLSACLFKAAANPEGLLKTTILDINGETMTADSNGFWPANAAKISFIFPEGYVTDGVSVGDMHAVLTDGAYTVDLSAQPLSADTEYQVTVNGSVYGTFTTGSGAFTVAVPVINADNTSTISVSNTEAQEKTIYIISASFDSEDNLVNLIYTTETVQPGASGSYSIGAPDITGASTLKVFVWNGFKTLVPYCAPAEKILN